MISTKERFRSILRSRMILCIKPPNVIVDPTVTLGPPSPQHLDSMSAKCAWMGNAVDVCWNTVYWVGVIVNVRSSLLKLVMVPVMVM